MEIKETEHFWIITRSDDNMKHFYDKEQWTKEQAIFDFFSQKIAMALSYALEQEKDTTTKKLIAQEFWNSLNRKNLIPNQMVEILINCTV